MNGTPKVVSMFEDRVTGDLLAMFEDGSLARRIWYGGRGEYVWEAETGPDYITLFCGPRPFVTLHEMLDRERRASPEVGVEG